VSEEIKTPEDTLQKLLNKSIIPKKVLEKIINIEGFSETFNLTLGEILESFADRMISHDYRGFAPDWESCEGWATWYYISNKYLWVITAMFDHHGEPERIIVKKYWCDVTELAFSKGDLNLPLLKIYVWDRRQDP